MKDICERFCTKSNIDINSGCFLYNGDKIKGELTLEESLNSEDKQRNKMNVLVTSTTNLEQTEENIYLKIDPEIEYQEIDEEGNKIEDGYNNYQIFDNIIDLGFKHTGFVKNFENNQPRYTFVIDLEKDENELFNNIHKSVRKKIKKTDEYNMILRESNDVDTFVDLLFKTCEKDDFTPYKREYYKDAMKYMDGKYKLFERI